MKGLDHIRLLRPMQWLKNLMIFFPPFLGGSLSHNGVLNSGLLPFVAFSFASSTTYILNDIFDRASDANHPAKKNRPVASGVINIMPAYFLGLLCLVAAVVLGFLVSPAFLTILASYLVIQIFYSCKLKHVVILDIFCIAAGFLLRLQAGGIAFNIPISSWLFLSVFLLALFLSTGKRLGEIRFLGDTAGSHRKSLASYPPGFLDGIMYMTGGAVMVTYTMFVISRQMMVYTVPLCFFGLLRYIYRVQTGHGGDPTEALIKDGGLFGTGVLWAIATWYALYRSL